MSMPSRQRKPPDDSPPPPGQAPDDDEFFEDEESVRLNETYAEHRVAGGAPATPEAYRRAVEQFQRLPGAARTRPGAGRASRRTMPPDEEPRPDDAGAES
jgi:hypothetical protein